MNGYVFLKSKAQIEDSDCFSSFMFIYLMAYYAIAFLLVAILSVVIYNKYTSTFPRFFLPLTPLSYCHLHWLVLLLI